jgi:hypothetical protein
MSQVKVRNLHTEEYVEMFRDKEIRIPAGGYVEMGRAAANAFLGQITPMNLDGSGECITPKKLRIDEDPEQHAADRDQPLKYTAPDGKQFRTQMGYDEYMSSLRAEAKEVEDAKPVRRRRAPVKPAAEAATV